MRSRGCREQGIQLLLEAKRETGLPIVTEIMDISQLPCFGDVDVIQVGARNMQNFELLKELGPYKQTDSIKTRLIEYHSGTPDERRVYYGGRQRTGYPV